MAHAVCLTGEQPRDQQLKGSDPLGPEPGSDSHGALSVHIGLHKTGTTSLQTFLIRNAEALADAGIWYPQIGRHRGPAHLNLKCELESSPRFDSALGTEDDVIAAVPNLPTTVVSSEDLSLMSSNDIESFASRLRGIDTWVSSI